MRELCDDTLALVWEAAEATADRSLMLAVLFALRDPNFAEALRAVLNGYPASSANLIGMLGYRGELTACNDEG